MRVNQEDREKVLANWPEAVWFPGDEPPVGRRALQITPSDRREPVTILGMHLPNPTPAHECPSCRCPVPSSLEGWWVVRLEGWWSSPGSGVWSRASARPRPPEGRDVEIIVYPPSLVPLREAA